MKYSGKSNLIQLSIIVLMIGALPMCSVAQTIVLRQRIAEIAKETSATVGVAMASMDGVDTLFIGGNKKLPMQSVFKFPLAMAVLDQVDKGKFTLDQKFHMTKKDLLPNTHSPIRDKFPDGATLTLGEVLGYTVSQSDNNGCDFLFGLMGGVEKVNAYVHSLGVSDIAIVGTEDDMHRDDKVQYNNYSTPVAMLQLLGVFYQGKKLSKSSNDFLWKLMVEATTGAEKIKGLLPAGTLVAHKTGNSGVNDKGFLSATNDVGIVALPNGKYFAIAIFVSDTSDSPEKCASVIAQISRAAYDYYSFAR